MSGTSKASTAGASASRAWDPPEMGTMETQVSLDGMDKGQAGPQSRHRVRLADGQNHPLTHFCPFTQRSVPTRTQASQALL